MVKAVVAASPGGDRINFEDWIGKLFVVEPTDYEKDIKTDYGLSDAIRANVWVLLSPTEHEEFNDTLIFPRVLVSSLKKSVGKELVVGRLEQGEAKKGQSAPWLLSVPTEKDMEKANAFIARVLVTATPSDGGKEKSAPADDEDAF